MKIFLFEWLCGSGQASGSEDGAEASSLYREGLQMLVSLANAFSEAGHRVSCLLETSIPIPDQLSPTVEVERTDDSEDLPQQLFRLAEQADRFLVVAPEIDNQLMTVHEWLRPLAHRSLGPTGALVATGSSKHRTAQLLELNQIQKPCGVLWRPGTAWPFPDAPGPWILKPDDGAGGDGLQRVETSEAVSRLSLDGSRSYRCEQLLQGLSASVAIMGGPVQQVVLTPVLQVFEDSPTTGSESWPGTWCGFDAVLSDLELRRSIAMVERALRVLPPFAGWIGMDLILSAAGPEEDRIIDLNPRLTSSWIGHCQFHGSRLVQLLIEIVEGKPVVEPLDELPCGFQFRL